MSYEAPRLTDQIHRPTQGTLVEHILYLKESHSKRKEREENEMKRSDVQVKVPTSFLAHSQYGATATSPLSSGCGVEPPTSLLTNVVELLPPLV